MDMKMNTEEINTSGTSWDCKLIDGIVPITTGDDENIQTATLAGFLIKGSIPQLPEAGVPWLEFLTGGMTFGELDYYVRESLRKADKETYLPEFDIQNDQLTMSVGKVTQEA